MPTPAKDSKPTRRRVVVVEPRGPKGVPPRVLNFTVELGATTFTLRPLGCRRGGPAEVALTYGGVYESALLARARETKKARRRKKK